MNSMPRAIDEPVRISDNGIRSFIPPTFCFDLRNAAGELVKTVSRVVLIDPSLSDYDAVAYLSQNHLWVTGEVTDYDAGPEARETGLSFTVRSITEAHGEVQPPG